MGISACALVMSRPQAAEPVVMLACAMVMSKPQAAEPLGNLVCAMVKPSKQTSNFLEDCHCRTPANRYKSGLGTLF